MQSVVQTSTRGPPDSAAHELGAAPVSAGTSPTRADRRHQQRAVVSPSFRPSCRCRIQDYASRMCRPPGAALARLANGDVVLHG